MTKQFFIIKIIVSVAFITVNIFLTNHENCIRLKRAEIA